MNGWVGLLAVAGMIGGVYTYIDNEKEDKKVVQFTVEQLENTLAGGFTAQQIQIYDLQLENLKDQEREIQERQNQGIATSRDLQELTRIRKQIDWIYSTQNQLQSIPGVVE